MITSGRRAKRPDGQVYRQMRRQGISGKSLLEGGGGRGGRRAVLRAAARSLRVLLRLFR